ncbi:MAG: hypothetical protein EOM19_01980 [Candidatus Moranbacteria bacterium]|nr:hypothetical protein [Candidatus Moranbacteria bacterium]
MSLGNLQKEFYKKETSIEEDRKRVSEYDALENVNTSDEERRKKEILIEQSDQLVRLEKESLKKRRKALLLGISVLVFIGSLAGMAVFLGLFRDFSFDENRVVLEVESVDTIENGKNVEYTITVQNKNWSVLENVALVVQYPASFRPDEGSFDIQEGSQKGRIDIGDFEKKSEKKITLKGKFFGAQGEIGYVDFFVRYATVTGDGRFEKSLQTSVTLTGSALSFDINGTLEVTPGEQTEYLIEYINNTGSPIYNAILIAEITDRFTVTETDPSVSQKELTRLSWQLGTLEAGESGLIKVRGAYYQEANSKASFSAKLGNIQGNNSFYTIVSKEATTAIVPALLFVKIVPIAVLNSIIQVGQDVSFVVQYANQSDIGLPSGIVQVSVDGDIWNYEKMGLSGGKWDEKNKTITWRASDVSELRDLAPGEKGQITFSLPVKERLAISGSNDKNFTSTLGVIIDSPDALSRLGLENVFGSDRVDLKLQTFVDVILDVKNREGIPLSDIRFVANEVVDLDVVMKIRNPYNDVTNAKLSFSIPSEMEWGGFLDGIEKETTHYDERRRSIDWDLGKIDAGTGEYRDAREIAFSLKFTPQEYQNNSKAPLVVRMNFSGRDTFVEKDFTFSLPDKETNLLRW